MGDAWVDPAKAAFDEIAWLLGAEKQEEAYTRFLQFGQQKFLIGWNEGLDYGREN